MASGPRASTLGPRRPIASLPPGLMMMMREFTVTVLKEHPENLYTFAKDYFVELCTSRCTSCLCKSPTLAVDASDAPTDAATNTAGSTARHTGTPKPTLTTRPTTIYAQTDYYDNVSRFPAQPC